MDKSRKQNWTESQIEVLVEECINQKSSIKGKLSSCLSHADKQLSWENIAERVNSNGITNRTVDDCKKKFSDLKSSAKKRERIRRREGNSTGGGPPPENLKNWEEKLVESLPEAVIVGVCGGLDTSRQNKDDGVITTTAALPLEEANVTDSPQTYPTEEINKKRSVHHQRESNGHDVLLGIEKRRLVIEERQLELLETSVLLKKRKVLAIERLVQLQEEKMARDICPDVDVTLSPILKLGFK